jgi:16S rRNA (adenine1518-N6/adenine1519-N6)-dimethyltransferase
MVTPKKHLGQHFLTNVGVAQKIADSITGHNNYKVLLEIGPGTGALTKHLLPFNQFDLWLSEIDNESVVYLNQTYPELSNKILNSDFLKLDLTAQFNQPVGIIGNFPYNISSQILFRVFDQKNLVPEVVGMFQKEVAQRIASGPGTKDYGILSVLLQAYYKIEYLFSVSEGSFNPPPKVKSGVIRLRSNDVTELECGEREFVNVVKTTFNQRRKTIRNSAKSLLQPASTTQHELFDRRPETLSVDEFVTLTKLIFKPADF